MRLVSIESAAWTAIDAFQKNTALRLEPGSFSWGTSIKRESFMKLVLPSSSRSSWTTCASRCPEIGVQGITVTEVKGFGRQKNHTELYRGAGVRG